jgi:hypothetical protein
MITALKQIRYGGLVVLWLLVLAILAVRAPAFFSLANFTSILQFSTLLALVTIGQTFVILAGGGGIDLSLGGIVSLSGLSIAFLMKQGAPAALAGIVGILFGGILGSINGLIITQLRLQWSCACADWWRADYWIAAGLWRARAKRGTGSSFTHAGVCFAHFRRDDIHPQPDAFRAMDLRDRK